MANKGECVQVMVRCRPMNDKEKKNGSRECIQIDRSVKQVIVHEPEEKGSDPGRVFTYDAVYGQESTQREVYDESAFPLIESVMGGYNGTIFAYGQTGCGKTHTMIGRKDDPGDRGIIPNAFSHIFGYFDDVENSKKKFLIRCSYLEIYNESIRDLLSKKVDHKLDLKEHPDKGVYVQDLTSVIVKTIPEIEQHMDHGTKNRMTGETAMNKDSSRSHSIFTIYIETAQLDQEGNQSIKAGKLNLVDLAGSERQSKTQATGQRLREATKINLSLSALGNVISALVEGKTHHVPYRDSKLTRLLQDSLGGNSKTVMIAAISPADYNLEETLTTLRYASRAKHIKNKPRINQDPKDALLKQYEEEIQKLKQIIEMSKNGMQISTKDLGQSMKMVSDSNIMIGGNTHQEESVDDLLAKLKQKGKIVKVLDESGSVRELPKQEDEDDLDRDIGERATQSPGRAHEEGNLGEEIDNIHPQVTHPSSVKKKIQAIKSQRAGSVGEEAPIVDHESAQRLLEQQQQQQEIIEKTNEQLKEEARKRDELRRILQEMEERIVEGGKVFAEQEKKQSHQQRKLQLELEKERKVQQELLEEKERQEAELLEKEQHYNSLQDEVEDNRKIIKKLKQKLKNTQNDLKDIHKENSEKNEELLDAVREHTKELDFLNQVMGFLLTDEHLYKIKEKTEWDEEKQKWKLPNFIIKQREIQFPKLGNAKQFIQEELEGQEVQFTPDQTQQPYSNQQQRRTNGFRKDTSRNQKQRGYDEPRNYNMMGNQSSYISSTDIGHRAGEFKMSRNESKSSSNFNKENIRNQQARIKRLNNDNYVIESPDIAHRKVNNKAGVQLAPLSQAPNVGAGRSSMMSIKNQGEEGQASAENQTDSHPILRVHNYKKPQLEKLHHQPPGKGITFNMDNIEGSNLTNGKIQMTFQATVSIDQPQGGGNQPMVLNSKKMHRKRDNAQLAPLHHQPGGIDGHNSQLSGSMKRQ